jgi:NitT/TauT family transport system ATP-binding protein
MNTPLIKLRKICKAFPKPDSQPLLVLNNINFELKHGEIVALLGKSGSGKSTLLRIIAGLIPPTEGEVYHLGEQVFQPVPGIAMVFQHFALMPWLTVLQNVELGLEAQGVDREERRQRALKAIDMIGLDGFESAFPKELSGGMRQRVGFARALVVNPDLLLMDEPFSALDVLTAENLRSDLLDLWQRQQTLLKSILMVTHDISEAAMMADRIIIFNSDPGSIRAELEVEFPHPRNEADPKIRELIDEIYALMTSPERDLKRIAFGPYQHKTIDFGYRLPDVEVSSLTGLIEEMAFSEQQGPFRLQDLSESLHLDVENLFPIIEILDILHFAKVTEGDIELTKAGRTFADADILEKKEEFASHLLHFVPLAKHIRATIDEAAGNRVNEEVFLEELEPYLTKDEAKRVLTTVIDWGRYAEIFAYNANSRVLSLEDPD